MIKTYEIQKWDISNHVANMTENVQPWRAPGILPSDDNPVLLITYFRSYSIYPKFSSFRTLSDARWYSRRLPASPCGTDTQTAHPPNTSCPWFDGYNVYIIKVYNYTHTRTCIPADVLCVIHLHLKLATRSYMFLLDCVFQETPLYTCRPTPD